MKKKIKILKTINNNYLSGKTYEVEVDDKEVIKDKALRIAFANDEACLTFIKTKTKKK